MAAALGYARTTVVAIEKGERRVTSEEFLKLVQHYGRSVADFVAPPANVQSLIPQFRAGPPTARATAKLPEEGFLEAAEALEALATDYRELADLCRRTTHLFTVWKIPSTCPRS